MILLVDDEPRIRGLLSLSLTRAGFNVLAIGDGKQALAEIDTHRSQLSIVITDINLGGRLNGWDVARYARARNEDIPVLYLSGSNAHEKLAHGVANSVLICKPFLAAQVIKAVLLLLSTEGRIRQLAASRSY